MERKVDENEACDSQGGGLRSGFTLGEDVTAREGR